MAAADRTSDPMAPWRAAALVLLAALLLSGIGVLLRYDADPADAHASVAAMPALLRALHHWCGALALVGVVAFAARAWLRGAQRERRYPAWSGPLGALAVAHVAFLSGRVLTWDQHGWESYAHVAGLLTAFGAPAPDPADARLVLVLALHIGIGIVAAIAILLLWRHHDGRAWSAFLHRAFVMPWAQRRARRVALGVVLLLVVLSLFAAPPLGALPSPARALAKPDLPFVWLAALEALGGPLAVWLGTLAAAGAVAAAPLAGGARPSVRLASALAFAAAWVGLSIVGLIVP